MTLPLLCSLLHLGRFDKPIGAVLLLFPCWWGVALVQGVHVNFTLLALFTLGAFVMRAAGCVVNDLMDRDIDRQVARTKSRPLASGEVTVPQALVFLFILCTIGLLVLLQLPVICWALGAVAVALALVYPLTKRILPFPQLILGMTFNMGIPIGAAALSPLWAQSMTLLTYLAAIAWTIAYDTIYALQDINDDRRLGVGSTALLFDHRVIPVVGLCYGIMHGTLGFVLYVMGSGPIGYLLILCSLGYILWRLRGLDKTNVDDCRRFFIANQTVGALVFLALMLR